MARTRINKQPSHSTGKEISEAAIQEKVALMMATGLKSDGIAAHLNNELGTNYTWRNVTHIMNRDGVKYLANEIKKEELEQGRTVIRQRAARLATKAMDVIERHLEEGNLQAVPHVYKALAITDDVPVENADQSITIVMPGAQVPKTVEAEFTVNTAETK